MFRKLLCTPFSVVGMEIFGHRCCGAEPPENIIEAAYQCTPAVEGIEIDVQRCGDGHAIVFYDETIDQVTDGSGEVSDLISKKFSIQGSNASIPRIDEFLWEVPDSLTINIELKSTGLGDLSEFEGGIKNDLIWSFFSSDTLQEIKQLNPVTSLGIYFDLEPLENLQLAEDLGCDYLFPHYEHCLESEFVQKAQEKGIKVVAWTVNSPELMNELEATRVDGMISDYTPSSCPA